MLTKYIKREMRPHKEVPRITGMAGFEASQSLSILVLLCIPHWPMSTIPQCLWLDKIIVININFNGMAK